MRRALGLTLIVISMLSTAAAAPAGETGIER